MEKFEDHVGMIHLLTRKAWARAQSFGSLMEYQDVFQEASIAFVKASEGFDPSTGYRFSTFYYQCFRNHFERVIEKEERHHVELGITSIDAMVADDAEGDPFEFVGSDNHTPERALEVRQQIEMHNYSPVAKRILELLVDPPQELVDEVNRTRIHTQTSRNWNSQSAFGSPTLGEICKVMTVVGFDEKSVNKAKHELIDLAESL